MPLQCVILAGGLGTRMRPWTETIPKALVPVLGRPFADWQLGLLAEQGVERVVYCAGRHGDLLRDHVGDGSRFGVSVAWSHDGPRLLGTAGAIRRAADAGLLDDAFMVLYGDSYLPAPIRCVETAWAGRSASALMTVLRNEERWDRSNCIFRDGRVVLYDKSRPAGLRSEMRWIDYGLSVLRRSLVVERVRPDVPSDLAAVLHDLSVAGDLLGVEVQERFYEVGSPAGLRDLEDYLRGRG